MTQPPVDGVHTFVDVRCPNCQHEFRRPVGLVGQQEKCPECRYILVIPENAAPPVWETDGIEPRNANVLGVSQSTSLARQPTTNEAVRDAARHGERQIAPATKAKEICPCCGSTLVRQIEATRKFSLSVNGDRWCVRCNAIWTPPLPKWAAMIFFCVLAPMLLFLIAVPIVCCLWGVFPGPVIAIGYVIWWLIVPAGLAKCVPALLGKAQPDIVSRGSGCPTSPMKSPPETRENQSDEQTS